MNKVLAFLLRLLCKPCPACGKRPTVTLDGDSIKIEHPESSILIQAYDVDNPLIIIYMWNLISSRFEARLKHYTRK